MTSNGRALRNAIGNDPYEMTVVFGNGVPAVIGKLINTYEDCFVLLGKAVGVNGESQTHVIPYTGIAYVRISDPVDA